MQLRNYTKLLRFVLAQIVKPIIMQLVLLNIKNNNGLKLVIIMNKFSNNNKDHSVLNGQDPGAQTSTVVFKQSTTRLSHM